MFETRVDKRICRNITGKIDLAGAELNFDVPEVASIPIPLLLDIIHYESQSRKLQDCADVLMRGPHTMMKQMPSMNSTTLAVIKQ